jgi:cyanophycin synthetase
MFDEIIIRQDKNLRGRSEDEIIQLMSQGINESSPGKKFTVIKTERDAIDFAIKNAVDGAFIVVCSDVVPDALDQIMKYKEEEDQFKISAADLAKV